MAGGGETLVENARQRHDRNARRTYLPADVLHHALAHLPRVDAEDAAGGRGGLEEPGHVVVLGGVLDERGGAPVAQHALEAEGELRRRNGVGAVVSGVGVTGQLPIAVD